MDKAEYKTKLEKINELAEAGDLGGAAGVADEIDWKHVKSVRTLCMIGEIYEANKRYDDGLRVLGYAYKRSAASKIVLYRLADLSVRTGAYEDAERYCREFEAASPNDTSIYPVRYRLLRAKKAPIDDRIALLQEYKEREYTEKWAYELARLYDRKGDREKCIEECDDMILWFSEGRYVQKAMELKMKYQPLTESQQEKYRKLLHLEEDDTAEETKETKETDAASLIAPEPVPESKVQTSAAEAIDKMDAAAETRAKETERAAQTPPARKPVVRQDRKDSTGNREIQDLLADSIRQVFAGIRPQEDPVPEEEPVTLKEEESGTWEVRDLEPECPDTAQQPEKKESKEVIAEPEKEEIPEQRTGEEDIDSFLKPDRGAESEDVDAILKETQSAFASEIASGNYELADTLEADRDRDQTKSENMAEAVERQAAGEAATGEGEDHGKETDESLGLTREFNFREELRKALAGGTSLTDAVKDVSAQAEASIQAEADSLKAEKEKKEEKAGGAGKAPEQNTSSEYRYGEISDFNANIPDELYADADEAAETAAAGQLADLSAVSEREVEESQAIVSDMMNAPEHFTKLPVEPRPLTDMEKRAFSYLAPIPGMAEQITMALADVHNHADDKTSRGGNILIMGRRGSGKTRTADGLVLAICRDLGMDAAKVARIVAEEFNAKDPAAVVSTLSGGFLLIEGAGALSDEAVDSLSRAMEFRTDDLIVILEDEKSDLRKMLKDHASFAEKFTSSITIPVFTNDELVTFGKTYCKEMGYKMDEMGTLALYTMIGGNQFASEPVTVGKVKTMLDKAIAKNAKRIHFGKNATTADGRIILREKDFNF